jgi:hypothetical protein
MAARTDLNMLQNMNRKLRTGEEQRRGAATADAVDVCAECSGRAEIA